jgi:hypothetical protein
MKKIVFILALTTINFLHAAHATENPEAPPHLSTRERKRRKTVPNTQELPATPQVIFAQAVPVGLEQIPMQQQVPAQQIFPAQQLQNPFANFIPNEKIVWLLAHVVQINQDKATLFNRSLAAETELLSLRKQNSELKATLQRVRAERDAWRQQAQLHSPPQ